MSLLLTASEIMRVLDMDLALVAVAEAFRAHGEGRVNMPPKAHLNVARGSFKAMYGEVVLPAGDVCGVKWNANFPGNPSYGRLAITGKLLLNDPETGVELADMDSTQVTRFRTGAAGGLAVKLLAREDASRLGLVGAGEQARTQVAAILTVRHIKEIVVYNRHLHHAQAFAAQVTANYGIAARAAATGREAVHGQDIVVTTTPSTAPVVFREWVSAGTHINAIGADSPGKQELDSAILKAARVVVDDLPQCREIGEINVPLARGEISEAEIAGTLGEVLTGQKPGRTSREEITVFDASGLTIQDLSLGLEILRRARERGLGEEKEFFS